MNTALYDCRFVAFDIFVMTLNEIGPLFALVLHFVSLTGVLAFFCRSFPVSVSFSSHVQKVVSAIILSLCISPSVYKPTKSPK